MHLSFYRDKRVETDKTDMYIPGIKKIEYLSASAADFPYLFAPGQSLNADDYISESWTELDIIKQSASVTETQENSQAGVSIEVEVPFKMKVNDTNRAEVALLSRQKHIYKVTDMNDDQYIIGTQRHRSALSSEITNESSPTGKKEIRCTITHRSVHGTILHDDTL